MPNINVSTSRTEVDVTPRTTVIDRVGGVGVQGPPGPQGPAGPQGPPGVAGGTYEHAQPFAATVWTINHNLGFLPNISTYDSSGRQIHGEIQHVDVNTATATFSAAEGGKATAS